MDFMKRIFPWMMVFLGVCLPQQLFAASLAEQLSGRILLAVEAHGEAWYVDPVTLERYFLGSGDDALLVFQSHALGITNADLAQIPREGEGDLGNIALRQRLAGRVLLAVESHGETWYVSPVTFKRTYLGNAEDAWNLIRAEALGITNAHLASLSSATLNETVSLVTQDVLFTSQAPLGEWNDARQQEGCEEASVFMAMHWTRGTSFTATEARDAIVAMSDWEDETYGTYYDTSVSDTADRLFRAYEDFTDIDVQHDIDVMDIRDALERGSLVVTAVNAQELYNPYYTGAGPLRHMVLVVGYDALTDEFIVHDPGTSYGESYRYASSVLQDALRDYPSGNHAPITDMPTAMIVVHR